MGQPLLVLEMHGLATLSICMKNQTLEIVISKLEA